MNNLDISKIFQVTFSALLYLYLYLCRQHKLLINQKKNYLYNINPNLIQEFIMEQKTFLMIFDIYLGNFFLFFLC